MGPLDPDKKDYVDDIDPVDDDYVELSKFFAEQEADPVDSNIKDLLAITPEDEEIYANSLRECCGKMEKEYEKDTSMACEAGNCTVFYCASCGADRQTSFGPVGCPCGR